MILNFAIIILGHDNALNNETIFNERSEAFSGALREPFGGQIYLEQSTAQSRQRLECGVLSLRQEIILLNGNNYSCYTPLLG
jgi:hypothetical protein